MDVQTSHDVLATAPLDNRARYQLLTTLVVPRPIAWISTYSADGTRNLAPFSYFGALAATPMLVGVSIGDRRRGLKDTLNNIRETGAFCINIVTARQLAAMNATAGEYLANVDEFTVAELPSRDADHVPAPFVADCPAVLECRLFKEVELEGAPNTLVIGEVVAVRLDPELAMEPGTKFLQPQALETVGRLGSQDYVLSGDVVRMARPLVTELSGG
ncbi:MAG TPA: flavin reductase family protein [Longimicrobiales bacterium]|nr:flavin reductase family protein [Longimicrobiales bacterium]